VAWTDLVHKFLPHGKYNATLPTLSDGANGEQQLDSRGRLIVSVSGSTAVPTESGSATSWTHAITHDDKGLVTATASKSLAFFWMQSSYATGGYLQFHNLAATGSLVTTVSVPLIAPIYIAPMGFASIEFPRAKLFSTGIVWAFSSTPNVWTEVAAATLGGSFEII
jgi:hypothetical protein